MFWAKARTIKALKAELNEEMTRADAMEKMRDTAREYLAKSDLKIVDLARKLEVATAINNINLGLQAERDQFAKRVGELQEEAKELRERIQQANSMETSPDRREVLEDHMPDNPV